MNQKHQMTGARAASVARSYTLSPDQERQLTAQVQHVMAGWDYYRVAAQDLDVAVQRYVAAVKRSGRTTVGRAGPGVEAARRDVLQAWQRAQDARAALIARVETEPAPAIRPALIAAIQAIGHWPPPAAPAKVVAFLGDVERHKPSPSPLAHPLLSFH